MRVKELCTFPDCMVDVTLQTGWWQESALFRRNDCVVNFAHIAWSQDSRYAAIFVDNGFCSSIQVGYDLKSKASVPFPPFADLVRKSITSEYKLRSDDLAPYKGDPLEWAHYPGDGTLRPGMEAFRKKHRD